MAWLWRPTKYLLLLTTALGLFLLLLIAAGRYIDPPIWSWSIHRAIAPPANHPGESQHQWRSLEQLGKHLPLAVIASEDQRFGQHAGFDWKAIERAIDDYRAGKPLRGASTISQQTSKNLFLWPSRSYLRKLMEVPLTALLEKLWGKRRILEVYLNIAEFGPGIFGAEAASQHYFNRPARKLSAQQAALLAAVLPNPYRFKAKPASKRTQAKARWIRKQMRQLGSTAVPQQ